MEDPKLKTNRFLTSKDLLEFVNGRRLRKDDIVALFPLKDQLVLFYFD